MSEPERRQTPTERSHELIKMALERPAPVSGVPSFDIDREKAVGGALVVTYKVHLPVCEWFPTPDEAFEAGVGYALRLEKMFPAPNGGPDLEAQLRGSLPRTGGGGGPGVKPRRVK